RNSKSATGPGGNYTIPRKRHTQHKYEKAASAAFLFASIGRPKRSSFQTGGGIMKKPLIAVTLMLVAGLGAYSFQKHKPVSFWGFTGKVIEAPVVVSKPGK